MYLHKFNSVIVTDLIRKTFQKKKALVSRQEPNAIANFNIDYLSRIVPPAPTAISGVVSEP